MTESWINYGEGVISVFVPISQDRLVFDLATVPGA